MRFLFWKEILNMLLFLVFSGVMMVCFFVKFFVVWCFMLMILLM